MKRCTICKIEKTLDQFSKRAMSKDGLQPRCKPCDSARQLEYYYRDREKNPDKYLKKSREQYARAKRDPKKMDAIREYNRERQREERAENPGKFREIWRESSRVRRQSPEFRAKANARWAVYDAVRKGKIVRQPCGKCGTAKAEAHHHDYSKPLNVEWLCSLCHAKEHRKYA